MSEIRIEKVKNGYILYDGYQYKPNHVVDSYNERHVFETQEALFEYLADNFKINSDNDNKPSLDNRQTVKVGI